MARATAARATATKRKRIDDEPHQTDEPPPKQPRHVDADADADTPARISGEHASAVLAVLEMADTQGLLDRVFPVESSPADSASLRALLAGPQPVAVLRAAVQHLVPISALPRAKPSPTATAQLGFCNLAASLLDQSAHAVPLSLNSILDHDSSLTAARPLRYALVQHLPSQDYWSSLTPKSDLASLKLLPTAHAELVAILPTPAPDPADVPTLAAYASTRPLPSISALPRPTHRILTTSTFLDYGPFASFAPSCDHNGETVPPQELALALYASHHRKQRRIAARRERASIHDLASVSASSSKEAPPRGSSHTPENLNNNNVDLDTELHELLPPEEIPALKSALASLQLENAVQELLDRNRAALVRLEELQITRIANEGEHSTAEKGSEEWDTAQGIMDSLAVLASLRPRTSSSSQSQSCSILPPPHILHKLHRTLAVEPTTGWYGTLPASTSTTRPSALRDDTTVRKSRTTAPAPAPVPTTTTPSVVQPPAQTVATPVPMQYTGYTYAYGAQQPQAQGAQTQTQPTQQPYRPAANGTSQQQPYQYTPQYYNYSAPAQQQQQQQPAAGVGVGQQNYYQQGHQQQGYASAAYSGWYNAAAYAQQAQAQAQSGSGAATPQMQATYGSFFGNAAAVGAGGGAGARTPAVANTVTTYTAPVVAQTRAAGLGLGQVAFGGGGGGGQQQAYYAQAAAAYQSQGQGQR